MQIVKTIKQDVAEDGLFSTLLNYAGYLYGALLVTFFVGCMAYAIVPLLIPLIIGVVLVGLLYVILVPLGAILCWAAFIGVILLVVVDGLFSTDLMHRSDNVLISVLIGGVVFFIWYLVDTKFNEQS
jgi:hypothetical protein